MTRKLLTLAFALTATLAPIVAHAQQISLSELTRYLNAMRSAKAAFVQANPDGTLAQGVLYLRKPGKIRYEYTVPDDSLVISDGKVLGIFDKRSNRGAQRYDLKKTPLDLLLRDNINLQATGFVRDVGFDGVKTEVIAADPKNPKAGTITMIFTSNPTELRQWVVQDKRGRKTTVILNNLSVTNRVSQSLFDIEATEAALRR